MAAIFWTNVAVAVQTALATAVTITAISKANPGVVTYTGTDPSNGDYVVLAVTGMGQVNKRVFRVANVNAGSNTFELEGENTTSYDTFAAGTAQVITFGASMSTAQNIQVSGGDPEFADTTTIHDTVRSRAPVVVSPLSFSMDCIYDLTDAALVEMNTAYKAKALRAVRLSFGTGAKMVFTGYPTASLVPTGQAQGVVQTRASIEAQNVPTSYSS